MQQQSSTHLYNSFQNVSSLSPYQEAQKVEQIYCDPEEVISKRKYSSEKHAVKIIMEKYDSLKCLTAQMDHLQMDKGSLETNSNPSEVEEDVILSEQDILQAELFFRSHKTHVSVCRCIADLYFFSAETADGDWEHARSGIPVVLLDKGETRARNKRMLQIALAEKGSGFVLWKDIIDNLSNYRAQDNSTFHTMYLSSDHRKMAGLSFHVQEAAEDFLREIEQLTSDPLNISLSVPKHKKKKIKQKKEKVKPPKKCEISTPCCFEHITSVAMDDKKKLYSIATLVSNDS